MYGKGQFNKTAFNTAAGDAASLYATIQNEYGTVVPGIRIKVQLSALTVNAISSMSPGMLWLKVPLPAVQIDAQYETSVKALRTNESEKMELVGINLAPGQRLIIDTDTMEISVDDEIRVDCWVTGGSFFQLKNGGTFVRFTEIVSSL